MSIKERIERLISKKNRITYDEMIELFGHDYRKNFITREGIISDELIFSEDDKLYYVDVVEDAEEKEYIAYGVKKVDQEMFEDAFHEYKEIMNRARQLEKIIFHKKFRLRKVFLEEGKDEHS